MASVYLFLQNFLLAHPGYPSVDVDTKKLKSAFVTHIAGAEAHGKEESAESMVIWRLIVFLEQGVARSYVYMH